MTVIDSKETVIGGATAVCYKCRNQVVLGLTDRGAVLPLDPEPAETGALAVSAAPGKAPRVRYLRGDDTGPQAGEQRMRAHWDTHPACKVRRHRAAAPARPRHRPAPASPATGRNDLTLEQLATADLSAIVSRVLPERSNPGPFSSAI
jgi:hypothetical protein